MTDPLTDTSAICHVAPIVVRTLYLRWAQVALMHWDCFSNTTHECTIAS